MRRFCWLFIVLCNVAYAADSQQVCAQANALYGKHEYARAYELYESVEPKNSIVWYNMGNCMYKQGDFLSAYLYWHRARRDASVDLQSDIAYNISKVQGKLGVESEEEMTLIESLQNNVGAMPLLVLQLLFLCVWGMLTFYFIKMSGRGRNYKFVLGCLVLTSGMLVGTLMMKYQNDSQRMAFITHDKAGLLVGPDAMHQQLSGLKKADRVKVVQLRNGWAKIEHKNQVGWVTADSISIV